MGGRAAVRHGRGMTTDSAPRTATIEVFRPGTFGPMQGGSLTFSADDLRAAAHAYDPQRAPAPVVVGHPIMNAPAFGWVTGLKFDDARERLLADVGDLDPAFADAVRAKRYRRVSLCFFHPANPANPSPGKWYPRHLGFLGAAAPAVTGLAPVSFAGERDDSTTFEFDFAAVEEPAFEDPMPTPDPDPSFASREAALASREAALAARERQIVHDANVAFAARLVDEGRVLAVQRDQLVTTLDAVEGAAGEVSFAAGEAAIPPAAALRRLLSDLPVSVPLGGIKADPPDAAVASFAAPDNRAVDPDRLALHAKALAWQRRHPGVDYLAAVRAVEQEG